MKMKNIDVLPSQVSQRLPHEFEISKSGGACALEASNFHSIALFPSVFRVGRIQNHLMSARSLLLSDFQDSPLNGASTAVRHRQRRWSQVNNQFVAP
jgi:hypothetical protein